MFYNDWLVSGCSTGTSFFWTYLDLRIMQYEADSPKAYIDMLEDDWRKDKLMLIRSIILESHLGLNESIEYKMLAFKSGSQRVFHLNAQKNFVGLYVGNIYKVDPELKFLSGYNIGKGCIRIKKSNKILESGLSAFIRQAAQMNMAGHDISC